MQADVNIKIMIIDCDSKVSNEIAGNLIEMGYSIIIANTFENILDIITEDIPDLIIMDPIENGNPVGLSLIEKINTIYPQIILFIFSSQSDLKNDYRSERADFIISKILGCGLLVSAVVAAIINKINLEIIYHRRPFKSRNAEELELSQILDLFVNPIDELHNPFEYENRIIKGRMGSGKTMYLKANYAYYFYTLVASLIEEDEIILPIFIRLSDFQHLLKPEEVYREIIIKIIYEISRTYQMLQNAKNLAIIHSGIQSLPNYLLEMQKQKDIVLELKKLKSDEYIETVSRKLGILGGVKPKFFEFSSNFEKTEMLELKKKAQPGISDIKLAYDYLLSENGGKIILLIDEAGSLNKSFFRGGEQISLFETLMNQLRTAEFLCTKIAVYPHSYSDILAESRYGNIINLKENILAEAGYLSFRKKTITLISRYISKSLEKEVSTDILFDITKNIEFGDCIEQIIFASEGNIRRLMQILDLSMFESYKAKSGVGLVTYDNAILALKAHSKEVESLYTGLEVEFIEDIVSVCRSRKTFRFQFPYKAPILSKFVSRSEEQNLLRILEAGTGRRGTIYAFDYAYCVFKDIPTHYISNSERIDKGRSLISGEWIRRITDISEELVAQAKLPGKIEGIIEYVSKDGVNAFVRADDSVEYFAIKSEVIQVDSMKQFILGKQLRFYPAIISEARYAMAIEIL
jgi:hypothetical protein